MMTLFRAVLVTLIATCFVSVSLPPKAASAHPMGNFTINRYSAITVASDRVDILYVIDMAEIPAYQELGTIRTDHDTNLTPAEREAYTSKIKDRLLSNLSLTLDGKPLEMLTVGKPALAFPPGAGGLPTLRLELSLTSSLQGAGKGTLEYKDSNYAERIGWKEIVARPGDGVNISKSSVPITDLSDVLHKYPVDLLNNPPQVLNASIDYEAGTAPETNARSTQTQAAPADSGTWGSLGWVQQQTGIISDVLNQQEIPFSALLLALAIAFSVGAAHALSPGHGKTVVAAYLVGSRGTPFHAIMLGLTVTVSHTIGVFLLGFVVLYLANFILPEALYPWLSFFSGAVLVVMGITLFLQRLRLWREQHTTEPARSQNGQSHSHGGVEHTHTLSGQPGHQHTRGTHDHKSDQNHEHNHEQSAAHNHDHSAASVPHSHGPLSRPHTHLPADGQKVTLRNLLLLGITGGIIPCPSALVVLLVAIASGKVALGMLLILAFSMGLAVVLMSIGLLMVFSRGLLNRFTFKNSRLTGLFGRLPMLSALVVSVLGFFIAAGAFNLK